MPITWCYEVADSTKKYCSPGFPVGCWVTENGQPKDACVINNKFKDADTYYVFNHVDIEVRSCCVLGWMGGGGKCLAKLGKIFENISKLSIGYVM